jgi:hypothetical protein
MTSVWLGSTAAVGGNNPCVGLKPKFVNILWGKTGEREEMDFILCEESMHTWITVGQ